MTGDAVRGGEHALALRLVVLCFAEAGSRVSLTLGIVAAVLGAAALLFVLAAPARRVPASSEP